jgi:predicted Zn-dependent peptidase
MKILSGPVRAICLLAAAPLLAQHIPVTERTLGNGMRVLLVERHDVPTIAAGWVARVGSANEHAGMTGMAHLFEHMMFKGTATIGTTDARRDAALNDAQDKVQAEIRKELDLLREQQRRGTIRDLFDPKVRSPRHQQLLREFEQLVKEQRALTIKDELAKLYSAQGGSGLNAETTQDRTFFHIDIPSNKFELWAWMESDRLLNARFREFYSERDVVLEERRMRVDATPGGLVKEAFKAMTWQAHPYQWPVIGWPSDVAQLTREQANAFFATYYAPNNITAVIVGDFRTADVLPVVERYFGRIPGNRAGVPAIVTTEPAQPAEQRMLAEIESNPMLAVAYKAVPEVHRDSAPLGVLSAVLSGASGRLRKELVLKQKVATSANAGMGGQTYGGEFVLEAQPAAGQRPEDLEAPLYAELERIARDGISDYELQKVKNQVQASAYAAMESNGGLRNALAEAEASGSYRDFLEEPALYQAVTREDVQRVARTYFKPENRSVLIIHRKTGGAPAQEAH